MVDRHGPRASSARSSARSGSTCSAARSRRGSRPRSSRRSGSGSRCCSSSATQDFSILTHTLGAEALSGGSVGAGDARRARGRRAGCSSASTPASAPRRRRRRRGAPRPAGDLDRAAQRRRARDPQRVRGRRSRIPTRPAVVAGRDVDPVTTAVVASFGSWSAKPFAAVVLVAFLACGMAAQALTARTIYSIARDGVLPGLALPARASTAAASPIGAIVATTVVACLGLLLGLHSAAVGSLIAFGTAAIYVAFLLVALAALIARVRGTWMPAGSVRLGRAGVVDQRARRRWLAFETVNIAWPRASLAPPGSAGLPGLGGADPARGDRRRRRHLPRPRPAAAEARGPLAVREPDRHSIPRGQEVRSKNPTTRRSYSCGCASMPPMCPAPGPPRSPSGRGGRVERLVRGLLGRLAVLAVDEEHGARDLRGTRLFRSAGGQLFEDRGRRGDDAVGR